MKTQLDIYDELSLEQVCDKDFLTCWVRPLVKDDHNRKSTSEANSLYRVEFRDAADYMVLQEVTDVLLGLEFGDSSHLSETMSTKVLNFLQLHDLFPGYDIRHFVLRTAHSVVHVFGETPPRVFLEPAQS